MNSEAFLKAAREFASNINAHAGSLAALEEKTQMNPAINREEINARLEAIEARMDARVAGMSAKLDTALAEMRADREANTVRFTAVNEAFQNIKEDIKGVHEQSKSLKSNIWFAAATTIASVLAAWALAFSAFDSGRETSKSIAEANVRMEKLQAQLEAQAKAKAAAADTPAAPTASPQQ